jgi:hypothetical protein
MSITPLIKEDRALKSPLDKEDRALKPPSIRRTGLQKAPLDKGGWGDSSAFFSTDQRFNPLLKGRAGAIHRQFGEYTAMV